MVPHFASSLDMGHGKACRQVNNGNNNDGSIIPMAPRCSSPLCVLFTFVVWIVTAFVPPPPHMLYRYLHMRAYCCTMPLFKQSHNLHSQYGMFEYKQSVWGFSNLYRSRLILNFRYFLPKKLKLRYFFLVSIFCALKQNPKKMLS